MDKLIGIILEKIIYPILLFLQKKHYVIPIDTSRNNIVRKNVLINLISICADWICAFLIIYGWNQKIVTYISLMTISSYTFVEQFKIYIKQCHYLRSDMYICEVRQQQYKYLRRYTPNLKNMIISGFSFLTLLCMTIFEGTDYYEQKTLILYRLWVLLVLGILMFIKTKYVFLDTFNVNEFTFKKIDL